MYMCTLYIPQLTLCVTDEACTTTFFLVCHYIYMYIYYVSQYNAKWWVISVKFQSFLHAILCVYIYTCSCTSIIIIYTHNTYLTRVSYFSAMCYDSPEHNGLVMAGIGSIFHD